MQSFIPYIIQEGEQNTQIQEEIEIASILLIAMSRQGNEHPDAIVKVNYPFRIYESEEGNMVFDLLGLSKTEKKWLLPNDISATLNELEAAENSDARAVMHRSLNGLSTSYSRTMPWGSAPEPGSCWPRSTRHHSQHCIS